MVVASSSRHALSRILYRSPANAAQPFSRSVARSMTHISPPAPARFTSRYTLGSSLPSASVSSLSVSRLLHTTARCCEKRIPEIDEAAANADTASPQIPVTGERTPIGHVEQRLSITFTCSVDDCGHRSSHEFARRSYTHGIVIVQCPGCKNRHLIADNLSWFTETADEPKTIEEMVAAKGGKVRRGTLDGETIEIEA